MKERKEVTIYPSFWFLLVVMAIVYYLFLLVIYLDENNKKMDNLIKIEQQILMYAGDSNGN